MNEMRFSALARGRALALSALAGATHAADPGAMPAASAGDAAGPGPDCPLRMQEAEANLELGRQAAQAKRWRDAAQRLREAGNGFLDVAAACPAEAARANRQGEAATAELRSAEAVLSHQGDCQPRLDKALDLDLRATMARGEKGDPAQIEQLLGEAEKVWREAVDVCQPPHRDKAQKSLAATVRARAANAELLSAGPACDSAWKSASGLVDYARTASRDKRWDDAAMLYGKAVMAWEGAADKCAGPRQQQAQRRAEQAQVDAHNAEYCGPLWDQATDHTQRLKAASGVSATERDNLSVKAEAAWRETAVQCRGSSHNLARGNADALARERGTPLPPPVLASLRLTPAGAPPVAAEPVPPPPRVVAVQAGAEAGPAEAPKPEARPAEPRAEAARVEAPRPDAPKVAAPAGEVVLVAGDTTYRGSFAPSGAGGTVNGSGRVEWTNGESYVGTLVDGRKQGKGRFNWVGGQWYEGDWTDDRAVGQGVIQFAGGNRYEGSVLDGEPSGRGTLIFPSGDRYIGEFARGVFHGQGRFAWKNGNRYEGAWKLGRKHGPGRLTWASGDGWEGEFRDDQQTDNGKSFSAPK